MTLRHSRNPPTRRSSYTITPRSTNELPPHLWDPTLPNDAFPPVPSKGHPRKRRWIGNRNTILRMASFPVARRNSFASHEKRSHRLGRAAHKWRPPRGHESVPRDHIRWGSNPVRDKPRNDRIPAWSRLAAQSHSGPQLAGTSVAEDELQLQRGRDRAKQHWWKQWRRSGV